MPKTWNIENIHSWVLRNVNEQVATTRHPAAMTTMDCWWLIDRTVRNGSRWWLTISSTHKQIHHPMNDTMVLLHFSTHRSMVDTFSVAVAVLCGVWWWWWMIDFGWLIFRKKQVWDSSHSAARSIALDQEDSWRLCSRFEWDSGIDLNIPWTGNKGVSPVVDVMMRMLIIFESCILRRQASMYVWSGLFRSVLLYFGWTWPCGQKYWPWCILCRSYPSRHLSWGIVVQALGLLPFDNRLSSSRIK